MRILFTIIFIHVTGLLYSQNWAVFNKNYRYNYSLENESYTTVVIFADSTLIQGVDTIYSLNRIATKCDSCWFYYPEPGVADLVGLAGGVGAAGKLEAARGRSRGECEV